MMQSIWTIKDIVKKFLCLGIPDLDTFMIVKTYASKIGYRGVLKQELSNSHKEQIVRYHYGIWTDSQKKYSIIKKEILSIVLLGF